MLKDMLYEMLMKATRFVFGVNALEDLFNISERKSGRVMLGISKLVEKILEACWWMATQLFLISITGGLYLVWIAFKMIFKKRRNKRKEKQTNKKRA